MVLLGVAREEELLPAAPRRASSARPRSAGAELQALGDERAERVVLDVARGRDDDVPGAVALAVIRRDVAVRERAHRRGAADHRPAELVVAEHAARRQVVHEIGGIVLDHRDLLEHDLALGLERLGLEARARGHVAHDVERERQVLVQHAHVHDGRFARRVGVELGAQAIGHARDLDLVEALAALEQQVLDQVRDAGLRAAARRGRRRRRTRRPRPSAPTRSSRR